MFKPIEILKAWIFLFRYSDSRLPLYTFFVLNQTSITINNANKSFK